MFTYINIYAIDMKWIRFQKQQNHLKMWEQPGGPTLPEREENRTRQ